MGINMDAEPCPFCGTRLKHIGSWARSFDPPRLYHEWLHAPVICQMNPSGGDKPILTATDDPETQFKALALWNTRDLVGSPKP
jgi:hypothetical protein